MYTTPGQCSGCASGGKKVWLAVWSRANNKPPQQVAHKDPSSFKFLLIRLFFFPFKNLRAAFYAYRYFFPCNVFRRCRVPRCGLNRFLLFLVRSTKRNFCTIKCFLENKNCLFSLGNGFDDIIKQIVMTRNSPLEFSLCTGNLDFSIFFAAEIKFALNIAVLLLLLNSFCCTLHFARSTFIVYVQHFLSIVPLSRTQNTPGI